MVEVAVVMVFGCLFVIHFVLADSSPFMAAGSLIFSKNMLFGAGMRHSEYLIAFYTTYVVEQGHLLTLLACRFLDLLRKSSVKRSRNS